MRVGNVLGDPTQRECDAAVGWHAIPCPRTMEKSRRRASPSWAGTTVTMQVAKHNEGSWGGAAAGSRAAAPDNLHHGTPCLALDASHPFFFYDVGVRVGDAVGVMAGLLIALGPAQLPGRGQAASLLIPRSGPAARPSPG